MIQSWVQSLGLLVLRVSLGTAMLGGHGLDKLLHYSTKAQAFPNLFGLGSHLGLMLAIFAEFFCAVLLILGIGTRLAVIPLIVTMLVALTVYHRQDPWAVKELSAIYLAGFVSIFICGGGGFSLDRVLSRWRKRSAKK